VRAIRSLGVWRRKIEHRMRGNTTSITAHTTSEAGRRTCHTALARSDWPTNANTMNTVTDEAANPPISGHTRRAF
jgi:Tfp pilus assembly protein PilN